MRLFLVLLLTFAPLMAAERIITLSPSLSEMLFALGAGSEVVGVSDYASYPEAVKSVEKVGGYFHPSLEKIVSLRPTLVIAQPHHRDLLQKLQRLGLKTLEVKLESLEDIRHALETLGSRLMRKSAAQQLIAEIDRAIAEAPKSTHKPRVLIIFGAYEELRDGIYIAGNNLFFEEVIEACGGVNAYADDAVGQPALNYEGLIALNPDRVILLYSELTNSHVDLERVTALWKRVPVNAARNERVAILKGAHLLVPSHRVARTINEICEEIARD